MIAIIDYGVGNLFSLKSSLASINQECIVTAKKEDIENADKIILPGVGAFSDAIKCLENSGLIPVIRQEVANGKPLMGICLGMQMLFERSFEYGEHKGLGLLKGDVISMKGKIDSSLKIPHMGWNGLDIIKDSPLMKYTKQGEYVYYVHSYFATNCDEAVVATSNYGIDMTGVVQKENIMGTQFHPEKSGEVGLRILKAFAELKQ